jgi:DNA-binding NarL/FixJ family response regulator
MFQLALIALHRNDPEAAERVQRCLDFTEQHRALWSRSYALWLQAVLRWRTGDPDGALPLLHASIELRQPVDDQTGLAFCVEVIAWCEATNRRWRRAAMLLGAAYAVWKHSGANTSYDSMHRFAHDEVEREVRARLGPDPFAKAYAEGAQCSPEEAVSLAMQKRPVAETAAEGIPDHVGRSLLTRREKEVAALVADGLTNREIASTLVISPRTAESHVENIMSKLGFSSRSQIASWLADQAAAGGGRDRSAG